MTDKPNESELLELRKAKLDELRASGNAFPNKFKRDSLADDLHSLYGELENNDLEKKKEVYSVAGRIMLQRIMGKASFMTIQDMSGQIQAYLTKNDLPEGVYESFKAWDLGDIVGLKGKLFKTKTGELTIHANEIELLTKSLKPLPEKHAGLVDTEQRYRKRYLDLITNEESREIFKQRSFLIKEIRSFFDGEGFMEVETPMMHSTLGGAAAKPFITHHNTLDLDLYLRIAPELYLKRLVVGGIEKVFEINRNFRNEGLSTKHNPEFTMLEYYTAYADFNDQMLFLERLFGHLSNELSGTSKITIEGKDYDLSKPFKRIGLLESIATKLSISIEDLSDRNKLEELSKTHNIEDYKSFSDGKLQFELFEKVVEDDLIEPTFIIDYPVEVSPLSRLSDNKEGLVDRFELFIGGNEIANGFSELNDPEDQAERFKAQVEQKASGDEEAMEYDEEYIEALEYGLPPCAGVGIGIDRLVMLFTGAESIRDVLLFPQMKPKS